MNFCKEMNVELNSSIPNSINNIYHLILYRFCHIYNLLKEETQKYNKIMMSDLTDVIFQEDPFSIEINSGLYLAAEQSILNDKYNSSSELNMDWIKQYSFLNDLDHNNFNNKYIICAGTILGYYNDIIKYLNDYCTINKYLNNDQAFLNIYIYNYNKEIEVIKYTESKILTLDKIDFNDLDKNEKGLIVNKNKEVYSIIHQIDRCNLLYMLDIVEKIL